MQQNKSTSPKYGSHSSRVNPPAAAAGMPLKSPSKSSAAGMFICPGDSICPPMLRLLMIPFYEVCEDVGVEVDRKVAWETGSETNE
ncbi:13382_t:CDS:2 [Funneliformis geosporum]|uniref:13382_t:CDS:1 n=1 Tax=Funneliformis geosporum TaxID=1117311 RepID=A0A9W4WM99_9GLOM|nr:13382_t:CDS:2 [Funneliformis geosporum]